MTEKTFADDRYEKMPYRRCGASGLKLPAVSLGFWQNLGEPGNEELCRRCCYHAFDRGVTHFDLANNYGPPPGNSEIVVGQIIKDMPRDELIVSTKAGYGMWPGPYGDWGSKKFLVASLDQSLRRMGLEYVDIFYHHRPDPGTPLEETFGALDLIVRQGKALYAGVSNYSGEPFARAVRTVRQHDWTPITIHQAYVNMLDRKVMWDLLPHAAGAGTGVIAFGPIAGGRLSTKYLAGLPADSRFGKGGEHGRKRYEQNVAAGVWEKVSRLNDLAKAMGRTLPQVAMQWLLADERITSVLIGVSCFEQLDENLKVVALPPLGADELKKVNEVLGPEHN